MRARDLALGTALLGFITFPAPARSQTVRWSATFDGGAARTPGSPALRGVRLDGNGNTYVAGRAYNGWVNVGTITKHAPAGNVLWSQTITDGPPIALHLDEQDQPILCTTWATVRFDADGRPLARTLHVTDRGWVAATACANGGQGRLVIAGTTLGDAGEVPAIVSFKADGLVEWQASGAGAGLPEQDLSIDVDEAGRVYVGGQVAMGTVPETFGYRLLAYEPLGIRAWSVLAEGMYYHWRGALLSADPGGGVYLSAATSVLGDWSLFRFEADGRESWEQYVSLGGYLQPAGLETFPDGAVVALATPTLSGASRTLRVDRAGAAAWFGDGPPVLMPQTGHLANARNGWTVVALTLASGAARLTAYEPSGAIAWSRDETSVSVFGVAIDEAGRVRQAARSTSLPSSAQSVVAFGVNGSVEWRGDSPFISVAEWASATRLDPFGNSIVLGTGMADGLPLLRVMKYDAAGALAWSRSAFPGHFPAGLAVGPSGESIVAAQDYALDRTPVLSVAKYDAAGNEVWTRSYPVAFALMGNATAVAVSAAGEVFVAGWASDFVTSRLVAVKYSPNGDPLWAFLDSSPGAFTGEPVRLALLPGGGAVVAGHVYDRSVSRDVLRVCATDPAGTEAWVVQLDQPTTASALTVGDSGRVFVAAAYAGLYAIDPGGVVAWSLEPRPEEFPASVNALANGPGGTLAVAYTGARTGCLVEMVSPSGARLWSQAVGDVARCWALRTRPEGGVFAGGSYLDFEDRKEEALVAALDADGRVLWTRTLPGIRGDVSAVYDLDADALGNVVAAGTVHGGSTDFDVLTLALHDDPPPRAIRFYTVAPCRAFDSRDPARGGPAPLAANARIEVPMAGVCGVPAGVLAVAVNVTVTSPTARGHATQYPAGHVPPTASVLNHGPGQTRASQAVARLGDGGRIGLRPVQAGGSLHVIVDVAGYFE